MVDERDALEVVQIVADGLPELEAQRVDECDELKVTNTD